MDDHSNTAITKAGEVLRALVNPDSQDPSDAELVDAVATTMAFRGRFQEPLETVAFGLRELGADQFGDFRVGYRLKRVPAIADKLRRLPTLRLVQMAGVAGCRLVLKDGPPAIEAVSEPIGRAWNVVDVVEIQLRTPRQHQWAVAVENATVHTGFRLKDNEGPEELLRYFRQASLALALEDNGQTVDKKLEEEFAELRELVRPYFEGTRQGE